MTRLKANRSQRRRKPKRAYRLAEPARGTGAGGARLRATRPGGGARPRRAYRLAKPACYTGGEGGIRTPDAGITDITVFETAAFNRSATSPRTSLSTRTGPFKHPRHRSPTTTKTLTLLVQVMVRPRRALACRSFQDLYGTLPQAKMLENSIFLTGCCGVSGSLANSPGTTITTV